MKALALTGIRQMDIIEVPDPEIVNGTDVLLKIAKVGVCGSDVHYYETGKIGSQVVQYPYMVGHECSAIVHGVGSAVTNVKPGDEVVVEPAISCFKCDQCLEERFHTCRELKFLGCPGQIDGCLSEYLVMPQVCCLPTHGKITLDQGVMCEPFAIGVYAVQQASVKPDDKIAILGSGPIGLSCLAAAKAQGLNEIYMSDKIDERVAMAQNAGAVWSANIDKEDFPAGLTQRAPGGMDVVFECCGQQQALDDAIEMLRPGGKLMIIGIPREDRISFSIDLLRRKEITLINVRRQNECTQTAIDLIASAKADVDFMVTHHFGFERCKEAFDLVADYQDGVVKAIIDF